MLKGEMIELNYKLKADVKFERLKEYGFYEVEPKDINKWLQCNVSVIWWNSLGKIVLSILINKQTKMLYISTYKSINKENAYKKIDKMLKDDILEVKEQAVKTI